MTEIMVVEENQNWNTAINLKSPLHRKTMLTKFRARSIISEDQIGENAVTTSMQESESQ